MLGKIMYFATIYYFYVYVIDFHSLNVFIYLVSYPEGDCLMCVISYVLSMSPRLSKRRAACLFPIPSLERRGRVRAANHCGWGETTTGARMSVGAGALCSGRFTRECMCTMSREHVYHPPMPVIGAGWLLLF